MAILGYHHRECFPTTRSIWKKKWLVALLVKGNAALIINRIPSFPLPDIDGEL